MLHLKIDSRVHRAFAALALAAVAIAPPSAVAQTCDQLFANYQSNNYNWWWGALGNCKTGPGGITDRTAIFNCAWAQVPASEQTACLRDKLLPAPRTSQGIDVVVAYNSLPTCDQLFAKYQSNNYNWWWGAFGNCKKPGGPADRDAIFNCAWAQVPASEQTACLKGKLLAADRTSQGIDNVAAYNGSIANNFSTVAFTACRVPNSGCPEQCGLPHDGSVPSELYYAPQMPPNLADAPLPAGVFGVPPAHNIGPNEGRLRSDLRAAARLADPLACSLHVAAILHSQADADALPENARAHRETAQAFADLSVTGHNAFAKFRQDLPNGDYCKTLSTRPIADGCPAAGAPPSADGLVAGCLKALKRAYDVANFLRAGQALQVASPWYTAAGGFTPAADLEQKRKQKDRSALGWIAVSGEDDSPHRPVNVPSSPSPQYDMDVDVGLEAPAGVTARTVRVRTRFVVAQSNAPAPVVTGPASQWTLAPDPLLKIDPNAEILLFIHGMDSRAEEAEDITKALFTIMQNSPKNLVVISVDLPTSGYAENLDYDLISALGAIGSPKWTPLPVPVPIPAELGPLFLAAFAVAGLPPRRPSSRPALRFRTSPPAARHLSSISSRPSWSVSPRRST